MRRLLVWLLTQLVALAAAAWLLEGIRFAGPASGIEELQQKAGPLVEVAVVLGLVTALIRPVLRLLSAPLILVTLGLFLLVINAAMLMLTSWVAGRIDLGFHVDGFTDALLGAIVITVVGWVTDGLLGGGRRR